MSRDLEKNVLVKLALNWQRVINKQRLTLMGVDAFLSIALLRNALHEVNCVCVYPLSKSQLPQRELRDALDHVHRAV